MWQLVLKRDDLGLIGSSDLPQSTQGVGGLCDSLALGLFRIPFVNRFAPIRAL
jgi:hypothetical protein